MKHILSLAFIVLLFATCTPTKPLETVNTVDLSRYAGTWYEIARLPNNFERGLTCVTATYRLKDNGNVQVVNRGYKAEKDKWKDARGFAKVPDPQSAPGELKVYFFWPFGGDYYVMQLADDYSYALVGSPSRDYLWVLSRDKEFEEVKYRKLVHFAREKGFPVDELERIPQNCDN